MRYERRGRDYLLKLEPGDEVIDSLRAFAREEKIGAASLVAIGAMRDPVIGYFDLESKEYLRREFGGNYEIVGLTGNLARKDGEPMVHAHVVIGSADFSAHAGHLFRGTISVTGEFVITPIEGEIERRQDAATGLPLWNIP